MTRVAILQSAYIPWKGYFDIIGSVDVFVVYDDVQYSKNHWHNRNLIKTQHGLKWLTVPVDKAAGAHRRIDDIGLPLPFAEKHWRSISQAYARAPFFRDFAPRLQRLYEEAAKLTRLTDLNQYFLRALCGELGLTTPFLLSRDLPCEGAKSDRVLAICQHLGATRYLSGPSARAYLELEQFAAAGIAVDWMDYSGYPNYPQLYGTFEHGVSVIDLIFNAGPQSRRYMKSPGAP